MGKRKRSPGYERSEWEPLKIPESVKGMSGWNFILVRQRVPHTKHRFAFVDFSSTEHATSALINPKNHHLNGRDLVVEYASAEAVRRGAPKGQKQRSQAEGATFIDKAERKPRMKKDLPPHKARPSNEEEKIDTMEIDQSISPAKPKELKGDHERDRGDRDKGRPRGRPKPGAALALAKRESAAIVPSQGQKITF